VIFNRKVSNYYWYTR